MKHILLILSFLLLFTTSGQAAITDNLPVDRFPTTYDVYYSKYTKRNFGPVFDYRWFKAQTMAESAFKPTVKSPVGAKGLMQIMDPTMKEIVQRSGYIANSVYTPKWNIAAGIYYDNCLYRGWGSKRPELDRLALMFASYNAGLGNPLKAQKLCLVSETGDCNLWANIRGHASEVRTWRYEETLGYVTRIFKFMGKKDY